MFDGSGTSPWTEDDAPAPLNAYGRTKLAGEEAIRSIGGVHAIVRSSWIISEHGDNFVLKVLRLAHGGTPLEIVEDQIGGPTPASDLAAAMLGIANSLLGGARGGLYHFSGTPDVSWADLGREVVTKAGLTTKEKGVRTSDRPTPVRRPRNSRLDCSKLGRGLRDCPAALESRIEQDPVADRAELNGHVRKGIILAGGSGTRLYPVTLGVSKQLLPIFDKPMVYYPLSVLMLAGIREIAIITTPWDQEQFRRVLMDGSQWGLSLTYIVQSSPDGLAQAYILADKFLDGTASAMVLGDNLFFGYGLSELLRRARAQELGATVFGYQVADPGRYGVLAFDAEGNVSAIVEKPPVPPSRIAVCGLYFLDGTAPDRAKSLVPSARGELEITDLLESYLTDSTLQVLKIGRGHAWLDVGTHDSLLDAGNFVRTLTQRQGLQIGSPGRNCVLPRMDQRRRIAFPCRLVREERLRGLSPGPLRRHQPSRRNSR